MLGIKILLKRGAIIMVGSKRKGVMKSIVCFYVIIIFLISNISLVFSAESKITNLGEIKLGQTVSGQIFDWSSSRQAIVYDFTLEDDCILHIINNIDHSVKSGDLNQSYMLQVCYASKPQYNTKYRFLSNEEMYSFGVSHFTELYYNNSLKNYKWSTDLSFQSGRGLREIIVPLGRGSYKILITAFSSKYDTPVSYSFKLVTEPFKYESDREPNDDISSANEISVNSSAEGRILLNGDIKPDENGDFYKVNIKSPGYYSITLTSDGYFAGSCSILDSSGKSFAIEYIDEKGTKWSSSGSTKLCRVDMSKTDGSSVDFTYKDPKSSTVKVNIKNPGIYYLQVEGDVQGSYEVSMNEEEKPIKSIQVTPLSASVFVKDKINFKAKAIYTDNTSEDITEFVDWSVDKPAIAKIDDSGILTALGPGKAIVYAKLDDIVGKANVEIKQKTYIKSIETPKKVIYLKKNQIVPLTIYGIDSNGKKQDITTKIKIANLNPKIISISGNKIKALASGKATLNVTYEKLKLTITVYVK